jgi:chromate transporter
MSEEPQGERVPLSVIARQWLRLGCIGFGGPPAHIALLRKLCVDDRHWLDAAEFEDAIAACTLLPGPASTELAIFCAWRVRGRLGALAGGAAFIVPGLILILALSALFLAASPPQAIIGAGAGAGSAVAAVALQAAWSLVPPSWKRASAVPPDAAGPAGAAGSAGGASPAGGTGPAGTGPAGGTVTADDPDGSPAPRPARGRRARWVAYLVAGGVSAATIGPWLVLVLLGCGLTELAIRERAARPAGSPALVLLPLARPTAPARPPVLAKAASFVIGASGMKTAAGMAAGAAVLAPVAWVAFKVGALSFGGGFVIIPLMQADAVSRHWMTSTQFLNAVALGQVTPGPVVLTVAAVGFAAFGLAGGLLATVVAFAPSFLFILGGARYFEAIRANARPQAFLDGSGPAAIGAIGGSAYLLAAAMAQPWQYAILAAAALLLFVVRRGVVLTLVSAAAAGLIIAVSGGPLP